MKITHLGKVLSKVRLKVVFAFCFNIYPTICIMYTRTPFIVFRSLFLPFFLSFDSYYAVERRVVLLSQAERKL